MIELLWNEKNTNHWDVLININGFIAWLSGNLKKTECNFNGFIVINDKTTKQFMILLCCDNDEKNSQRKILNVLQQPEGEFKTKYVARVLNDIDEAPEQNDEKKGDVT